MASQNLNVGTGANANNGDSLRAAFIKVKQMFAEVYGQTYSEQGDLSGTDFKIDANRMDTTNSAIDGYVLTYDSSSGGFTFEEYFNGDITRVTGGSGLSGDTQTGNATITLDINNLTEAALDVANDDIAFVDTSDSNTTRKESIADIMTAVAGSGLTATNGVLDVSVGTNQIANDAVDGTKLEQFDDSLTAATAGHILVSNGTDFIHTPMSGDATIASGGALSLANDVVDHDQLADRFTKKTTLTGTGNLTLECDDFCTFILSGNIATSTITFNDMKQGQVVDVIFSGSDLSSAVITLADNFTTSTINKIGTSDFDTSATNHLQAVCIDDTDSSAIINYTVSSYATQTNPAS